MQQLVKRYESEGAAAYVRPLAPTTPQPHAVDTALEDKIVRLPKTLTKQGYDAGTATIADRLARDSAVSKVRACIYFTCWHSPRNTACS